MKLPEMYKDFKVQKNFCSYSGYCLLPDGVALKNKKNGRIYCFQYVNLERGRGEPKPCLKGECRYYIYVNPNQTKLTDFGTVWGRK
jgi:hypothetical protein